MLPPRERPFLAPSQETQLTLTMFDLLLSIYKLPKLAALLIHRCVCLQVQPAPFLDNEPWKNRNMDLLFVYHCVPHTILALNRDLIPSVE